MTTANDFAGTFSFCERCPASKQCCSRTGPGGQIDEPVLMPGEAERIAAATNLETKEFIRAGPENQFPTLQSTSEGCLFHTNGRCAIHKVRPLDCKLFPFDLFFENGCIQVFVYKGLCPIGFDESRFLDQALALIERMDGDQVRYAQHRSPRLDKHSQYRLLGTPEEIRLRVAALAGRPAEFADNPR